MKSLIAMAVLVTAAVATLVVSAFWKNSTTQPSPLATPLFAMSTVTKKSTTTPNEYSESEKRDLEARTWIRAAAVRDGKEAAAEAITHGSGVPSVARFERMAEDAAQLNPAVGRDHSEFIPAYKAAFKEAYQSLSEKVRAASAPAF